MILCKSLVLCGVVPRLYRGNHVYGNKCTEKGSGKAVLGVTHMDMTNYKSHGLTVNWGLINNI